MGQNTEPKKLSQIPELEDQELERFWEEHEPEDFEGWKENDLKFQRPVQKKDSTSESGFTLIEIVMAVLLLAIAIAPILAAFKPALFATSGEEELSVFTHRARGTLNRLMTFDFQVHQDYLDAYGSTVDLEDFFEVAGAEDPSDEAGKETFPFKGDSYTPTVTITDQSSGAGGLLEITVTVANVSVQTLKAEY